MRFWLVWLLTLSVLFVAAASTAHAVAVFEPIHEPELARALGRYQNLATLDAQFKQKKILKDMDMALSSEGELRLKLPHQVVYQVNKPSRLVVTISRDEIVFESGSGSQATTQKIKTASNVGDSEKRSLQAMVNWLKMDPVALAHDYDISTDHSGRFRFVPHAGSASPFQEMTIEVGANGFVKQVAMNETSGDRIEFVFETPKLTYRPNPK